MTDILNAERPHISKEQYDKLKESIRSGLNALENNTGKKSSRKQRLLHEHCMLAGAIAALDAMGFNPPAMMGVSIIAGRSLLED